MPYNFVADSFHTKKLCTFVADFLQGKCDFTPKTAILRLYGQCMMIVLGSLESA